jgi:surfactin synthase thioesterase subunit
VTTPQPSNTWLNRPQPGSKTRLRLFCFPYAGGGASLYRSWAEPLASVAEIWSVQLPGRENRLGEPLYRSLPELIGALTDALQDALAPPYAFFGHSLGGLIAFELARALRRQGRALPLQLFVSGHLAPQLPQRHPPIHGLPYAQFVQELRRYRGTPEAVLANHELLELLLPVLRADFQLFETYVYQSDEPLDCPISAFGGLSDVEVSQEDLAAWRRQTRGLFTFRLLPGNHFFIQSAQAQLLQALGLDLSRHVSAVRPTAA